MVFLIIYKTDNIILKIKNLISHKKFSKKCDQFDWEHIFSILEMYLKNIKNKKLLTGYIDQLEKLIKKDKLLEENVIVKLFLTESKKTLNGIVNNKEIVYTALVRQLFTNNNFDKESMTKINDWVIENYPDENLCLKDFHPDNEKKTK